MSRRCTQASVALVLAVASTSSPAMAARVAVLPALQAGSDGEVSVHAEVGAVLRYRRDLELLPESERPIDPRAIRACESNRDCIAGALRLAGVDLLLIVAGNLGGGRPFLSLQLLESASGRIRSMQADLSEGGISTALRRTAGELLAQAGHAEMGRIVVVASPSSAEVTAAGGTVAHGGDEVALLIPPGDHTVRGRLAGYRDATADVHVTAGKDVQVALHLEEDEAGLWTSPWLWVAVGVAVAGAVGTGVAVSASSGGGAPCLCLAPAGAGCPGSCP